MVYYKFKIQMTFYCCKGQLFGISACSKAKFFWQDFQKWKSVIFSDYTQSVLRREEKSGEEKTCHTITSK